MRFSINSIIALSLVVLLVSPLGALPSYADEPQLNFKIYNPDNSILGPIETPAESAKSSDPSDLGLKAEEPSFDQETPEEKKEKKEEQASPVTSSEATSDTEGSTTASTGATSTKRLEGYIRVVPTGTNIPIIMDTAVDSDTSQEADEFSARTAEDLTIDGSNVVPAGSIIKGRIAQLNSPRHLNRSGSVALKFDTITTPDNRQIPLVATLVARGGVVHARRGLKDIAIDTGAVALPTLAGLGIGLLAGNSSSDSGDSSGMGAAGGAMIGAGVGLAVGIAILLSKKGKKIDLRPGDELKIQLAEELRMPMM